MSSMSFFGDPEGADEDIDPSDADGRVDLGDQLRHSKDVHSAFDDLLANDREPSDNDIDEILDSISFGERDQS